MFDYLRVRDSFDMDFTLSDFDELSFQVEQSQYISIFHHLKSSRQLALYAAGSSRYRLLKTMA